MPTRAPTMPPAHLHAEPVPPPRFWPADYAVLGLPCVAAEALDARASSLTTDEVYGSSGIVEMASDREADTGAGSGDPGARGHLRSVTAIFLLFVPASAWKH